MIVIFILLILYGIYEFWVYYNKKKVIPIKSKPNFNIQIVNKVQIPKANPIKSKNGCHHYADIGLACPTEAHTYVYNIMPFQYINEKLQEKMAQYLQMEWGYKNKYTVDTILEEWPLIDAIYVMTNKINNNIIGCVAIDRKHFFPFISHLFVISEYRGKGYGSVLMDFALKTVKLLGFNKSKLWCDITQINYYKKMGWKIEDNRNDLYIMSIDI